MDKQARRRATVKGQDLQKIQAVIIKLLSPIASADRSWVAQDAVDDGSIGINQRLAKALRQSKVSGKILSVELFEIKVGDTTVTSEGWDVEVATALLRTVVVDFWSYGGPKCGLYGLAVSSD